MNAQTDAVGLAATIRTEPVMPLTVLIVDDRAADAAMAGEHLRRGEEHVDVRTYPTLGAIEPSVLQIADVLLLDLDLVETSGLATVSAARRMAPELPLVVHSSIDDEGLALEAIDLGAQDYVVKGTMPADLLMRTLRHAVERQRVMVELEEARRRADHAARHDALTGLASRQALFDHLALCVRRAEVERAPLSILFIDLDGFKPINDRLGHERGDEVLRATAHALVSSVRIGDLVARIGGDEFVVVLHDTDAGRAAQVAARAAMAVNRASPHDRLSASIGTATFPADARDADGLLRAADQAMYVAKRRASRRRQNAS